MGIEALRLLARSARWPIGSIDWLLVVLWSLQLPQSCTDELSSHILAGISRSSDACVSDIGVFRESVVVSVSCQMHLLFAMPAR